jgi:hypothetical protein
VAPVQRVVLAIVLMSSAGMIAPARADAGSDADIVAILPFTFADDSLALYSKAAATALARELRGVAGVEVETVSLADSPPSGVALVIDGRLVPGQKAGTVSLELTVRDPEFGVAVASVSTRVAPLSDIDTLVSEAGRRLRSALVPALDGQRERLAERGKPIQLRPTVVRGEGGGEPAARDSDDPKAMLVLSATASIGKYAVPVSAIATQSANGLAETLGYRPTAAGVRVVNTHREAAALAAKEGAMGALKVHVEAVSYEWAGVLTARGLVRIVLTAADGTIVFDRTVRTDTVVGSRGDHYSAIVRMVCDQAMDIAAPPIKRALADL